MVIASPNTKLADAAEHEAAKFSSNILMGAITNGDEDNKVIAIGLDAMKSGGRNVQSLEEQDKQARSIR